MTYKRLPSNIPQILREAGLKVEERPGWKSRGRPVNTGEFDAVGVLCHHTATKKNVSIANVLKLLEKGRSDLPGPLCHFGLGRDGTVYVIASGRANHAGKAKKSGTVAAGDGNKLYIGIEAFNDGVGEAWPKAQYEAYVTLCAILSLKVTGNSVNTVRAHKETSVTGKIDPTFNMETFRAAVAKKMLASTKQPAKSVVLAEFDVAAWNVKALAPHMKTIEADFRAIDKMNPELVLWQELTPAEPNYVAPLRKAITRLSHYIGRPSDRWYETPISHDPKVLTKTATGVQKIVDGKAGVTGNRFLTRVSFTLKAHPTVQINARSIHNVNKAFDQNGNIRKPAGERLAMWRRGRDLTLARLKADAKEGIPQVIGGDWNRKKVSPLLVTKLEGRRVQAVSVGLDWLHFIDGEDYVWQLVGKPVIARPDTDKDGEQDSDHPILLQKVRLLKK